GERAKEADPEEYERQTAELASRHMAAEKALADTRVELARVKEDLAAGKMRCPRDGESLVEEPFEGIMLYRCIQCGSNYAPPGELERLLVKARESAGAGASSQPVDAPAGKSGGWFKRMFKRPKGEEDSNGS